MNRRQFLTYAGVSSASLILPSRAYSQSLRKSLEQLTDDFDKPKTKTREDEIQREKTQDVNIEDYLLKEEDIVVNRKRTHSGERLILCNQYVITGRDRWLRKKLKKSQLNYFFKENIYNDIEEIEQLVIEKEEKIRRGEAPLIIDYIYPISDSERKIDLYSENRIVRISPDNRTPEYGTLLRPKEFLGSLSIDGSITTRVYEYHEHLRYFNFNLLNFRDNEKKRAFKHILEEFGPPISYQKDYKLPDNFECKGYFYDSSETLLLGRGFFKLVTALKKENMLANFSMFGELSQNNYSQPKEKIDELIQTYAKGIISYVQRTKFEFTGQKDEENIRELIRNPTHLQLMKEKGKGYFFR